MVQKKNKRHVVRFLIEFLEIQHDFGIQTWPVIPGGNTIFDSSHTMPYQNCLQMMEMIWQPP
jgi:hypothetical protein